MAHENVTWAWRQPVRFPVKIVLLLLAEHSDQGGRSYPSKRYIRELTGLSEATVHRVLRTLRRVGMLEVDEQTDRSGRSRANLYRLRLDRGVPISVIHEHLAARRRGDRVEPPGASAMVLAVEAAPGELVGGAPEPVDNPVDNSGGRGVPVTPRGGTSDTLEGGTSDTLIGCHSDPPLICTQEGKRPSTTVIPDEGAELVDNSQPPPKPEHPPPTGLATPQDCATLRAAMVRQWGDGAVDERWSAKPVRASVARPVEDWERSLTAVRRRVLWCAWEIARRHPIPPSLATFEVYCSQADAQLGAAEREAARRASEPPRPREIPPETRRRVEEILGRPFGVGIDADG